MARVNRALTLQHVVSTGVPRLPLTGEWAAAFGEPERRGVWYVFGNSGSGKTSFVLLLMKMLSYYGRVLFLSYEEGKASASLQDGIVRFGLLERQRHILVSTETIDELAERLSRKQSADFIVIDSLELSGFKTRKQVQAFVDRFPHKLFIFIGQAVNRRPRTTLGEHVLFLANQKIYVEGYRAHSRGRSMGELGYLTVWAEGARAYWEYSKQ